MAFNCKNDIKIYIYSKDLSRDHPQTAPTASPSFSAMAAPRLHNSSPSSSAMAAPRSHNSSVTAICGARGEEAGASGCCTLRGCRGCAVVRVLRVDLRVLPGLFNWVAKATRTRRSDSRGPPGPPTGAGAGLPQAPRRRPWWSAGGRKCGGRSWSGPRWSRRRI